VRENPLHLTTPCYLSYTIRFPRPLRRRLNDLLLPSRGYTESDNRICENIHWQADSTISAASSTNATKSSFWNVLNLSHTSRGIGSAKNNAMSRCSPSVGINMMDEDHSGQGNSQSPVTYRDYLEDRLYPALPIDFLNHSVNVYQSPTSFTIYDPSYGTSFSGANLAEAKLAWEQYSMAGFCWLWTDGNLHYSRQFFSYQEVRTVLKPTGDLLYWQAP
jgi:hypothetical protein